MYIFDKQSFNIKIIHFLPLFYIMMMISGATAQTEPWPPFMGFMIVL
jgi:hypothetical protein